MATAAESKHVGRQKRYQLGVFAVLAALASSLVVWVTPGAAHAQTIPCPTDHFVHVSDLMGGGTTVGTWEKQLVLVSATPTFDRVDGRVVDNNLDTPIVATFTSQQSSTFTIAVTTQVQVVPTLLRFFKLQVSNTITSSRTTSIGVNAQATVPPHSRVIGDYGIASYDITYDVKNYSRINGVCSTSPFFRAWDVRETRHAPTDEEGWRIRLG